MSAGTLAGTTTSLQGNITDNANVTFNQASNDTYAGVMSGTGGVTITGGGTVTLSGNNTYTGTTTIQQGGLTVGGTFAGPITVKSGTTLTVSSTGTVNGVVTVEAGGNVVVQPGGSVTQQVVTATSLGSSVNPSTSGQSVTFTATVSGSSPTGTVNFKDGGTTIGTCGAQPLSGGTATCTTSSLAAGSHTITAVYSGDSANTGSTSASLTQKVNALTSTPTGTATPAPTPTITPTPSNTPTATTPTSTGTPTSTLTPEPEEPPPPPTDTPVPPTATRTPSPTPTATRTPTPTATGSATATPTSSPTATRSPTATPPGGAAPGGAFTLTDLGNGSVRLSWRGGTATSLNLVRSTALGETTVALGVGDTSAADSIPTGLRVACWQLRGTRATPPAVFSSDLLCLASGLQTGLAPTAPSLRLNQSSVATLFWVPPAGITSQLVLPLGTTRILSLSAGDSVAVDDTHGAVTCYLIVERIGTSIGGFSNVECAVPGLAVGLADGP